MGLLPELYQRLTHPVVRDLAFALLAPPLVPQAQLNTRHPLSASIWRQQPQLLANWLIQQQRNPASLLSAVSEPMRLGRYYEALWHFALTHAPDIKLLAHNWVIYAQKRSIGEIDFLIKDQEGIHHLELAVKFYAAPRWAEGNLDLYLGPNSQDSLGTKIKRLTQHQLKLTEHPITASALREQGIGQVAASAHLTGYLFYPEHEPNWRYHGDWQASKLWVEVPKQRWLSPYLTHQPKAFIPNPDKPQMLARMSLHKGLYHEQERLLLLPNHWPEGRTRPL